MDCELGSFLTIVPSLCFSEISVKTVFNSSSETQSFLRSSANSLRASVNRRSRTPRSLPSQKRQMRRRRRSPPPRSGSIAGGASAPERKERGSNLAERCAKRTAMRANRGFRGAPNPRARRIRGESCGFRIVGCFQARLSCGLQKIARFYTP